MSASVVNYILAMVCMCECVSGQRQQAWSTNDAKVTNCVT